jgi:hypothetical protein
MAANRNAKSHTKKGPTAKKGPTKTKTPLVDQRFQLSEATTTRLTLSPFELTPTNRLVSIRGGTAVTSPGGATTLYASGPPNMHVTISLQRLPSGHAHSGGPTGSVEPSSFTLPPQWPELVPIVFRAPDACGKIRLTADGGTQIARCFIDVVVGGLTPLIASTGIALSGSKPSHPSNHWGTPALVAGLQELGRRFFAQFQKNIWVNDISLPVGGLFDFQNTWTPPHRTHRDGRDADVNWSSMSADERQFFSMNAEALGFRVEIHPNPPHWHLHM